MPEQAQRAKEPVERKRKAGVKAAAADHPWRRFGVGAGKAYWEGQKAKQEKERADAPGAPVGAGPASRLRSGERRRGEREARKLVAAARRPAPTQGARARPQPRKKGTFSPEF